jgi:hypothetical protein
MRYYDTRRAAPQPREAERRAAPPAVEAPRAAKVKFDKEPLWAYGFTDPAKPGDTAQPQAPPTSQPRPNQDLEEQMRRRHVAGSAAAYSLVQIRDLHNVVDWFLAITRR